MAERKLTLQVVVDDRGAVRSLRSIDTHVDRVGETAKKSGGAIDRLFGSGASIAKATAGFAASAIAVRRLTGFISESITLFGQQEDAIVTLNASLESQGAAIPGLSAQYQEMASALQGVTTFGDEALIAMQALLIQVGDVGPSQMQAALEASTDLAAGLGIDLRTATLLVGKAIAGQTDTLTRYGIAIDKAKIESEGASAVFEGISAQFGGQAQAQAKSYSGQIQQLSNSWGDLKEVLAGAIIPLLTELIPVVRGLIQWFTDLSPTTRTVIAAVTGLAAVVTPIIASIGLFSAGIAAAIPIVTGIGTVLLGLVTGAAAPFILIPAAIAALVIGWQKFGDDITRFTIDAVTAIRDWLVDKFGGIVTSVKDKIDSVVGFFANMKERVVGNSIVPEMVDAIGFEVTRLDDVFVGKIQGQLDNVIQKFSGWAEGVTGIFGGLFAAGGPLMTFAAQGLQKISGLVTSGLKKIGGFFKNLFGGPSEAELAGREVANTFIDEVVAESTVGADRVAQAVADGWDPRLAEFALSVQDMFVEAGGSAEEAMDVVGLLFDSIKDGPGAVQSVIDRIMVMIESLRRSRDEAEALNKTLEGGSVPSGPAAGSTADTGGLIQAFPRGGVVRGLGGHVPILAQPGEFVIRRAAVDSIGAGVLGAINRGGSVGGGGLTINVTGFVGPNAMNELASQINMATVRQLQRQRQL